MARWLVMPHPMLQTLLTSLRTKTEAILAAVDRVHQSPAARDSKEMSGDLQTIRNATKDLAQQVQKVADGSPH